MRSDRTNCRIPAREENTVEEKGQENIPQKSSRQQQVKPEWNE